MPRKRKDEDTELRVLDESALVVDGDTQGEEDEHLVVDALSKDGMDEGTTEDCAGADIMHEAKRRKVNAGAEEHLEEHDAEGATGDFDDDFDDEWYGSGTGFRGGQGPNRGLRRKRGSERGSSKPAGKFQIRGTTRARGQRGRSGRGRSASEEPALPLPSLEALSLTSLGERSVAQGGEAEIEGGHDFEEIIAEEIPVFRVVREEYLRSMAENAYATQTLALLAHGSKSGPDKGKGKGKEDKERELPLLLRPLTTSESTALLTRILDESEDAREEPCGALRRLLVRKLKLEQHRRMHCLPSACSSSPDLSHEKQASSRILHAPEQSESGSDSGLTQKQQPDSAVLDALYAIRMTPFARSFAARLAGCTPEHARSLRLRQAYARVEDRMEAKGAAVGTDETKSKPDSDTRQTEAHEASVPNERDMIRTGVLGSELDLGGGFLHRDWSARVPWLDLMDDIYAHHALAHPDREVPRRIVAPIDYETLRAEHLPQVHALLERLFWPGIDVSDSLQYSPEKCTVVATYRRRLVVGAAFLSSPNETYITYLAVRAGWDSSQIATKMLYLLIARNPQSDIILHVSANNPAMLLYNRFGFKAEEFIVGFYEDYLNPQSRASKNAFRLRLRR